MKALIKLNDVDTVEATVTLTAKISEWRELRDQLASEWPSWKLSSIISDLLNKAEARFDSTDTSTP